ncbi:hypothetical protein TNCV_5070771 [Trichonephila clavipes]|nr:hypothetical protein TNCV_5070771 [Trichonephila clavipes]
MLLYIQLGSAKLLMPYLDIPGQPCSPEILSIGYSSDQLRSQILYIIEGGFLRPSSVYLMAYVSSQCRTVLRQEADLRATEVTLYFSN